MIEGISDLGMTLDLKQFKKFFSYIDEDGDGFVNFEEFCEINLESVSFQPDSNKWKWLARPLVQYSQKDPEILSTKSDICY